MKSANMLKIKESPIPKSKYYNCAALKSYQLADILMSVGGRGIGKTFAWKLDCIKHFIERGEQWIYLRRYDSEILNIDLLFNDIEANGYFPEYKFTVNNGRMWCQDLSRPDDEEPMLMGFIMALSKVKSAKGVNYPLVGTLLFDEFQLDDSNKVHNRYLKNEVTIFADFYETIARERSVRIIMLSNNMSSANPYFTKWKISPVLNKIIKCKIDDINIAVEMCDSTEFMIEKAKTRSGRLSRACGIGGSSIENKPLIDNDFYIAKRPAKAKHIFNIKIDGKYYGAWQAPDDYMVYFSKAANKTARTYIFKKEDVDEVSIYVKNCGASTEMTILKTAFNYNKIAFENQNIKFAMFEVFSLLHFF